MSGYRVESTPDADEHARAIDTWWREQRPASPDLFLDELTRALALLATLPMLGVPYERASAPEGMTPRAGTVRADIAAVRVSRTR